MEKKENEKMVLVVDDNENLRNVLIEKFNISGYKTAGAGDGEEGLAKAFKLHPDIILLDVLMPKVGGLEMLSKLREDKWGKKAKVIMLTVLENIDAVAQAVDKGTFVYLVKTNHSLDDVVKQVENVLGNR